MPWCSEQKDERVAVCCRFFDAVHSIFALSTGPGLLLHAATRALATQPNSNTTAQVASALHSDLTVKPNAQTGIATIRRLAANHGAS
jgi:hypothetical protein